MKKRRRGRNIRADETCRSVSNRSDKLPLPESYVEVRSCESTWNKMSEQKLEDRAVQPPLVQHVIKDGDCETTPINWVKGGTLRCKLIACTSCTSD